VRLALKHFIDKNKKLISSVPAKCRVRDEAPNLGPRVFNVLLGQGYCAHHGVVLDEHGAMME
jgi:hypothetical protein